MAPLSKKTSSRRPTVQWNEAEQAYMAWIRFPDGSRRKVKRTTREAAEQRLNELLEQRSMDGAPAPSRKKQLTFAEVVHIWAEAGYPAPPEDIRHRRTLHENTIGPIESAMNRILARADEDREIQMPAAKRREVVKAAVGSLVVERTKVERIQQIFDLMDAHGCSTDYIHRSWRYLNHATSYAIRMKLIGSSAVDRVYLPEKKDGRVRKSFQKADVQRIIFEALPADVQPVMWLIGLICGLRPGEIAGLRWCYVDIDSDESTLHVFERASEIRQKYVGQADPKKDSKRSIKLPPLAVAALLKHREEQRLLNAYRYSDKPYEADGFVFPNKFGRPRTLKYIRNRFNTFCENAKLGSDWTTYELRHSFVSLASDELHGLLTIGEVTGHKDVRTSAGYQHPVRPATEVAMKAWEGILKKDDSDNVVPLPVKSA